MSDQRAVKPIYRIRSDIARQVVSGVACPLGVFPAERRAELHEGYESTFIMGDDGLEDQCVYRVVLSSDRLLAGVRRLMSELLPDEVFGIYEEFSYDAFRETDGWISVEPVARERVLQAWDTYGEFFIEDGKCGFGARSDEPLIEVFVEEHGALYLACALDLREKVERLIGEFGIAECTELRCIESFEHQHVDVLDIADGGTMDDLEIKFSVIESLGMEMHNRDEGGPDDGPIPFWLYLELDASFCAEATGPIAFASLGVTARDHDEARTIAEARLLERVPDALIARVLQIYRMTDEDIGDDIAPSERGLVREVGVWFESDVEFGGEPRLD